MGAWGFGNFENDDALDWLGDLTDRDDISFLKETLNKANKLNVLSLIRFKGNMIDESDASEILAAAEVVAALNGKASKVLPEDAELFINRNFVKDLNDVKKIAQNSVSMVKNKSGLRELWSETEEFNNWIEEVEDLEARLY